MVDHGSGHQSNIALKRTPLAGLHEELGGRLCIATGTDTRSGVEILYHFMFPAEHQLLTLKTQLAKPNPEIESVGVFYPAVEWIERELYDILGVTITNHPDPRRILMSDDWPEDVYPLRRDFTGLDEEQKKVRCISGECDT